MAPDTPAPTEDPNCQATRDATKEMDMGGPCRKDENSMGQFPVNAQCGNAGKCVDHFPCHGHNNGVCECADPTNEENWAYDNPAWMWGQYEGDGCGQVEAKLYAKVGYAFKIDAFEYDFASVPGSLFAGKSGSLMCKLSGDAGDYLKMDELNQAVEETMADGGYPGIVVPMAPVTGDTALCKICNDNTPCTVMEDGQAITLDGEGGAGGYILVSFATDYQTFYDEGCAADDQAPYEMPQDLASQPPCDANMDHGWAAEQSLMNAMFGANGFQDHIESLGRKLNEYGLAGIELTGVYGDSHSVQTTVIPIDIPSPTDEPAIWYPDYETAWQNAGCLNALLYPVSPGDGPTCDSQDACCAAAYAGQVSQKCCEQVWSTETEHPNCGAAPTPEEVKLEANVQYSGLTADQAQNSGPGFAQAIGVSESLVTVTTVTPGANDRRRLQTGTPATGTFEVTYQIDADENTAGNILNTVNDPSFSTTVASSVESNLGIPSGQVTASASAGEAAGDYMGCATYGEANVRCNRGDPDFDSEGDVCANDGTADGAICTTVQSGDFLCLERDCQLRASGRNSFTVRSPVDSKPRR